MAFHVPPAHQSFGQDRFTFGPNSGDEFSVRKMRLLTIGQLEGLEESGAAIDFFGVSTTTQGEYIRSLDRDQFKALVEAWRNDSGVDAGESQASGS